MEFEWDARKAKANLQKHGVDFANAVIALEDENHNESRFKTLGMGPTLNVLYVVHCERSEKCIRIISVRKADKRESIIYFQDLSHE